MLHYSRILAEVTTLCYEVGDYILAQRQQVSGDDVELKSLNSLVSYVDKQAEVQLVAGLRQIVPEAGFIAEEGTAAEKNDPCNWIVDPLDGTTNYLHGIPTFAISVALQVNDSIEVGVVYELGQREMFNAYRGGGAFLNEIRIKVSPVSAMGDSLFATGFPYYDFERIDSFQRLLSHFFQNTRGLRRLGSAATDLAYVACGRFSGFFEYGLSPWDVAAGALLVEEAGGKVADFSQGDNYLYGGEIMAASKALQADFFQLVQEKMNGR